jgi:hypothetical protein
MGIVGLRLRWDFARQCQMQFPTSFLFKFMLDSRFGNVIIFKIHNSRNVLEAFGVFFGKCLIMITVRCWHTQGARIMSIKHC